MPLVAAHPQLTGFTVHPLSVAGGTPAQLTVTLAGPAPPGGTPILLAGDPRSLALIPDSFFVPEGETGRTIEFATHPVTAVTQVTLRATLGDTTLPAILTVLPTGSPSIPASHTIAGLDLNPSTVTGGGTSQATVSLSDVAPAGGTAVSLSSNVPDVAAVPPTVTVPAGAQSGSVTITTRAVTASTAVKIDAWLGQSARSATLTVLPRSNGGGGGQGSFYVAPNGSDSNPCSQAAPCATFDRAYRVARPGQTVEVACGVYPAQGIGYDSSKDGASAYVSFVAAPGCPSGQPMVGAMTELAADWRPGDSSIRVVSTAGFRLESGISIAGLAPNARCTAAGETVFTGCTGGINTSDGSYWLTGADVSQGGLFVQGADWVSFSGISSADYDAVLGPGGRQSHHVRFLNGAARLCGVVGGNDILFQNITFGPARGGSNTCYVGPAGPAGNTGPKDLVFDHVNFNENNKTSCYDATNTHCHDAVVYVRYANGLTVKNSRFFKYWEYALEFTTPQANPGGDNDTYYTQNVLIENNFFGAPICRSDNLGGPIQYPCQSATSGVYVNSAASGPQTLRNWTVQYNTFNIGSCFCAGTPPPTSNLVWRANYGDSNLNCDTHWTYSYNVFTGKNCPGTGNVGSAPLLLVDALAGDFRLQSGAAAIDRGDKANYPPTDFYGTSRPQGAGPDAGAVESPFSAAQADAALRGKLNSWSRRISTEARSTARAHVRGRARLMLSSAIRVEKHAAQARGAIRAQRVFSRKGRQAKQLALRGFGKYAGAGRSWAASGRERLRGHKRTAANLARRGNLDVKAASRLVAAARKVLR